MPKGGSKGKGSMIARVVVVQSGREVDLGDMPLVYGEKDSAVTGKARANIEAFEERRRKFKTEYATVLDEDGNYLTADIHGGRTSVGIPRSVAEAGSIMSHNHPRGKGDENCLGGTFSIEDMNIFANHYKTMRATAGEGTYSISKTKDFINFRFQEHMRKIYNTHGRTMNQANRDIQKRYDAGKISYDEALKLNAKAFNKYLVQVHNDLLAGQKEYGYTYTLEKH